MCSETLSSNLGAIKKKDLLLEVLRKFYHPSTALWKSIEARIISKIKFPPVFLDLGCGNGLFSSVLFNKIAIGLDISGKEIGKARRLGLYDELLISDACNLPFRQCSFIFIFSNSVLHHIINIDKVLHEISSILKEGGYFIFSVPSNKFSEYLFFYNAFKKLGLRRLAKQYSKMKNKRFDHFHCYDHKVWEKVLYKSDLKIDNYIYCVTKSAMYMWDILNYVFSHFFTPKLLLKMMIPLFRKLLYKYYIKNSDLGGNIIIVSYKEA